MSANGLHRIRWRRVAVERVHRTGHISLRKRLTDLLRGGGGKCRLTEPIGSDGDGFILTRAHRTRRVSACETLRKYYGNVERVEGMLITD